MRGTTFIPGPKSDSAEKHLKSPRSAETPKMGELRFVFSATPLPTNLFGVCSWAQEKANGGGGGERNHLQIWWIVAVNPVMPSVQFS